VRRLALLVVVLAAAPSTAARTQPRIVFEANADIYSIAPDGSALRRLTRGRMIDQSPAWSPDHRWIAFSRRPPTTSWSRIYVMRADGSGVRLVAGDGSRDARDPVWSPDGHSIAYSYGRDVWMTNGTRARQLTDSPCVDSSPSWSPDGLTIAFARCPSSEQLFLDRLWVVPAAGGRPRRVTTDLTLLGGADWAPDGHSLLVSDNDNLVRVAYPAGSLTPLRAFGSRAAWAPGGTRIAVTSPTFGVGVVTPGTPARRLFYRSSIIEYGGVDW
jgi:Tol biopolymer transport system component